MKGLQKGWLYHDIGYNFVLYLVAPKRAVLYSGD